MNNLDINNADVRKNFTEQELRIVARFLDFVNRNKFGTFSADAISKADDDEIKESVRRFVASRNYKRNSRDQ